MNFAILIPSYQPDFKLIELINALIVDDYLKKCPIIVIDDGSGSGYKKIFSEIEKNVHFITYQENRGKGYALKTGFTYILKKLDFIDAVVTIDGDGQHTIRDTVRCLKSYETNNKLKPVVLGSRNFEDNVPLRSKFGNLMTRDILSFSMGLNISDTQTGLRVIPVQYLNKLLELNGERYEYEMQMLLFLKENNIRIVEVPIDTIYIDENNSSHFNPIKDSLKIYSTFLKFIISSSSSFIVDISVFAFLIFLLRNFSINTIFLASFLSRFISSL
ncbi:glycosyltransferase family 2 protein [Streptococcus parauberis]|nr:glycosyltransferase family 2 protein [Streptococcus parauberis]